MNRLFGILVAAAIALGTPLTARADIGPNLLQDGSFAGTIGSDGWTVHTIPGFTATPETVIYSTKGTFTGAGVTSVLNGSSAPANFAVFNNAPQGGLAGAYLEQSFQTVSGVNYILTFQYFAFGVAPTLNNPTVNADLVAEVYSATNSSVVFYTTATNATLTNDFSSPLLTATMYFTGNGDQFYIDIADLSGTNFGVSQVKSNATTVPLVTNVSINAVPEPISLALMGTALVGLGIARRSRRA